VPLVEAGVLALSAVALQTMSEAMVAMVLPVPSQAQALQEMVVAEDQAATLEVLAVPAVEETVSNNLQH
jgi:hypothetical protein